MVLSTRHLFMISLLVAWQNQGSVHIEGDLFEEPDAPALGLLQRSAKVVQNVDVSAKIVHNVHVQVGGSLGLGQREKVKSESFSESMLAGLIVPSVGCLIVLAISRMIWSRCGWMPKQHTEEAEEATESQSTPMSKEKPGPPAVVTVALEDQGFVYRAATSGYLVDGLIPVWSPPAFVITCILFAVFGLPTFVGRPFTYPTKIMCIYFAAYISFDALLRLLFGYSKYRALLSIGFTHEEVDMICGDAKVIPTRHLLDKSPWVYRMDSYSRKTLHIVHWAGLAYIVGLCTYTTYQRFQFSVMGATCSVIVQLCLWNSTNFFLNMWMWLSSVRTGDGYARRMNNIYCTMSSVCGMGVVVPLCSSMLAYAFHGDSPADAAAFIIIVTYPCAWGDVLAEMVGVLGVTRFNVYGIGEVNNKSVEGMIGMFLGSVLPCLPWAWSVGGWPNLCIIGALATIAETWSPRGFDNVFIPLFSAVGVLVACSISGIVPHAAFAPA